MYYKYKLWQIFSKKLDIPKEIQYRIYHKLVTFADFINYDLFDKIPISCIREQDQEVIKKFGLEICKTLDWDLIDNPNRYDNFNIREILMNIDPATEDINIELYKILKDKMRPREYSPRMKEYYSDRFVTILEQDNLLSQKLDFNAGNLSLKKIVVNWETFKNKDLSYNLAHDKDNIYGITDSELKDFMANYGILASLIVEYDSIYEFIKQVIDLKSVEEKNKYVKNFATNLLNKTYDKGIFNYEIKITNAEFKELFKYVPIKDYIKLFCHFIRDSIISEIESLPENYLYNMPIPLEYFFNYDVLVFINDFGLKNIVDFDNECGHFFTKDDCYMLKKMNNIYLHYSANIHDPKRDYFHDKDGNPIIDNKYTKDQFYEVMRRMIVYGPTNYDYANNAPNYREMTGEFRTRFSNLFISDEAPDELQQLFYTKKITPELLLEHPEYIQYLEGKDLHNCFVPRYVLIENKDNKTIYENLYEFFSTKYGFQNTIAFITEYIDILEVLFNVDIVTKYELKINPNADINGNKSIINTLFRKVLIQERIPYPQRIPESFKEQFSSMFLPDNAPQELKDALYNRQINSKYIMEHPQYIDYLRNIDLDMLYNYMPITYHLKEDYHIKLNLVDVIIRVFGKDEAFEVMLLYGKYIDLVYDANKLYSIKCNDNYSKDDLLDELDKAINEAIINNKLVYNEDIPGHFKSNYPTFFLGKDAPEDIKKKFYNRELLPEDFKQNPHLLDYFGNTNIVCGMPVDLSILIPLFQDSESLREANERRLIVVSEYIKIKDADLKEVFREFIRENASTLDFNKVKYIPQVLLRLELSNSTEIYTFRKELARQIIKTDSPLESLDKIEYIFTKNNLPTVGKLYSCYEILHPRFDFTDKTISPVLMNSSDAEKKIIIFADLIKAAFGSNNRSVKNYIKNIEIGTYLYESIKAGKLKYEELDDLSKKELKVFGNHLITLYNNTKKAKEEKQLYTSTGDDIADINELVKRLSPDGTLDYNLGDRIIKMFCGFAGIKTLKDAKNYNTFKVKNAEARNIETANHDMILEPGDFIKGIGGIKYLRNILQNGSVAREYLGASAGSDWTPLDTDLSVITKTTGSNSDKIKSTAANAYGPIYFVLKNDDRFINTRNPDFEENLRRDMSKLEVFYTGAVGKDHYGIRTGFASSEINYIVMEEYDPRVGLEIAMNGFYIPVADFNGKIVFTPKDYKDLRAKMGGLSYYEENDYTFDIELENNEIMELSQQIEQSNYETKVKRDKINAAIQKSLDRIGLKLKTTIDGDLTEGYVELIDTGSTGRGTNKPGDGDFDFMMRLDKSIISNSEKLNALKNALLQGFGRNDNSGVIGTGDFRLKEVQIDDVIVDIDITFTQKTDSIEYSTDMALKDRLDTIKRINPEKYKYVVANILLAKKVLKKASVYKPNRGENPQGGLGGVGIESWILQNGGSFLKAARSFIIASEGKAFEEFKNSYQIWDFGDNHLAEKKGYYPHDNFVYNMSEDGYYKMINALKVYLNIEKTEEQEYSSKKI